MKLQIQRDFWNFLNEITIHSGAQSSPQKLISMNDFIYINIKREVSFLEEKLPEKLIVEPTKYTRPSSNREVASSRRRPFLRTLLSDLKADKIIYFLKWGDVIDRSWQKWGTSDQKKLENFKSPQEFYHCWQCWKQSIHYLLRSRNQKKNILFWWAIISWKTIEIKNTRFWDVQGNLFTEMKFFYNVPFWQ